MSLATPVRLMLPGTLCDGRLFEPLDAGWAGQAGAPERRVDFSLAHLAGGAGWRDALLAGLPDRFDVVGFSLGGLVALDLLRHAPGRVRRLVLVASNPQAATLNHLARAQSQTAAWNTLGPEAVVEQMAAQASPAGALTEAHLALLRAMARDTTTASFLAQTQLNATRPDGLEVLAGWPGRLMLLCGERDPWCGPEVQASVLERRPDARLEVMPGAGHYLPLEQAAPAAAAITRFLFENSD